eukprot:12896685-Prorocentrum_lima.AAC.1
MYPKLFLHHSNGKLDKVLNNGMILNKWKDDHKRLSLQRWTGHQEDRGIMSQVTIHQSLLSLMQGET